MGRLENKNDEDNMEIEINKTEIKSPEIYYKEIMVAEDFKKAETLFYEYIKHTRKKYKQRIFKAILMKSENYKKAEELICCMHKVGFNPDIQIYDIFLKKMEDRNDIINLYNKMKNLCIIMDSKFLKRITDMLIKTDEYYKIQYERDCFKQIQKAAKEIETPQDLVFSIENLFCENDIEENGYNYFILIVSLKSVDLVKKCIDILYERKVNLDEKIYMAILHKLVKDNKERILYLDILNKLKTELSEDEQKKLIELLNYHSKGNGGETKWLLDKDKLIKQYEKQLLIEKDIKKQQFLIGKIEALNFENYVRYKNLPRKLDTELEEVKAEEDSELYSLQISNLEGQLSAVQEAMDLYDAEKKKNMHILYIVYVESREFLYEVRNDYLTNYYYELDEIGDKKVNSFIMAFSFEEFIQYLNEADYNKVDVRVKIYGDSTDSTEFCNKSDENEKIYEYMNSNMQDKICFFTYAHPKFRDKDKNENAVSILARDDINISNNNVLLDDYYTIRYMLTLKNRIDKLDEDELTTIQKLGNYYIPILKGMLNRCIRRDQKDWKFIMTLLRYNNRNDILKDVNDICSIEEIIGAIRIDKSRFENIMIMIKNCISSLSDNGFFERLEEAEGILAEIILIRVDGSYKILNKTLNQNIIEREEARKSKTDLEKIPFKKLKKRFADDEEFMMMIENALFRENID